MTQNDEAPQIFPIPIPNLSDSDSVVIDGAGLLARVQSDSGSVVLRINLDGGCRLSQLDVQDRSVGRIQSAGWTGIQVGGKWFTSGHSSHRPKAAKTTGGALMVTGIRYGSPEIEVSEAWTFLPKGDSIVWKVDRQYLGSGRVESSTMPALSFRDMEAWTGAVLGSGGVAWCKLLDAPNATLAVRAGSATFWKGGSDPCLGIAPLEAGGISQAMRFSREPDGSFTAAMAPSAEPLSLKHLQYRFLRDRQDIWAPFTVTKGQKISASYDISALSYKKVFGRGEFKGLDADAISEMVNTIGRIGVIDQGRVGTNGWYSGYICMHEPWQARIGTAINDPNYTRSESEFLDFARDHAVKPDGMVMSRWFYHGGDSQLGTFDEKTGFYEAQWGRLMDSQSSYVWNVADQLDESGDLGWAAGHKASCEAALEYLLRRDSNANGLVEMENKQMSQRRSSDWLDIVWAGYENAFVNAQLYGALIRWASVEDLLRDPAKADHYRNCAVHLKNSFNKTIDDGGFWDPVKGWYIYWRDSDGSTHGNNLTVEVNLTALADGICDDPVRRKGLLDTIEARMKAESLLVWPACFESFAPGEGADDLFPRYENGDIFLSWAEYGIKAYADYDPQIALKYVKQLVAQYKKDGLAFQRYLRGNGQGAGDDILAGNCNVITGLYRSIFGIQPKHNRLLLDPHLTPELNGSLVRHQLRGKELSIRLLENDYRVDHKSISIHSSVCFGVDFGSGQLSLFPGQSDRPVIEVKLGAQKSLALSVREWGNCMKWTLLADRTARLRHSFPGLKPGESCKVLVGGKAAGTVTQMNPSISLLCRAGQLTEVEIVPLEG